VWLCGVCVCVGVWVAPEGVTKRNTVVNAGERRSKVAAYSALAFTLAPCPNSTRALKRLCDAHTL
jgi:hypothetical protein